MRAGNNEIDLANQIKNVELPWHGKKLDPALVFLLKRMMDKDMQTRWTLKEVTT
jgi:hypothetical protein